MTACKQSCKYDTSLSSKNAIAMWFVRLRGYVQRTDLRGLYVKASPCGRNPAGDRAGILGPNSITETSSWDSLESAAFTSAGDAIALVNKNRESQ